MVKAVAIIQRCTRVQHFSATNTPLPKIDSLSAKSFWNPVQSVLLNSTIVTDWPKWLCPEHSDGRIQPGSLAGAISVIFGSQVSLRVCYCKRDFKYTSQHCCDKTMVVKMALNRECWFSELYKIMANKVTFVVVEGAIGPLNPNLHAENAFFPFLPESVGVDSVA